MFQNRVSNFSPFLTLCSMIFDVTFYPWRFSFKFCVLLLPFFPSRPHSRVVFLPLYFLLLHLSLSHFLLLLLSLFFFPYFFLCLLVFFSFLFFLLSSSLSSALAWVGSCTNYPNDRITLLNVFFYLGCRGGRGGIPWARVMYVFIKPKIKPLI